MPLDEDARPRYEEAVELLFKALENEQLLARRHVLPGRRLPDRPVPASASSASSLGGTSDRTYELAAENGWGVAVPPLLPYVALEQQLDLYRAKCAEHGTTPDIVWIHACHLDEDRETALREARDWVRRLHPRQRSPLTEYDKPPAEDLVKAGYGFYAAGIMESLAEMPFEQLSRTTTSGSARRADVIERIEADARGLRGHRRDRDHRQRRRRAALDGDQEPGAVRGRRDAAISGDQPG